MSDFKVGFMVLCGITIFLIFHWVIQGVSFEKEGKKILTTFSTLNGIRVGSDVRVAGGLKVGKVRQIQFTGNRALLTLWIKKKTRITTSTTLTIASANFFGEKYISIEYASEPGTPLPEGAIIEGDTPFSISGSAKEFGSLMRKFNNLLTTGGGRNFLKKIDAIVSRTGKQVDSLMRNSEEDLKAITSNLSTTAFKLNNLIKEYKGSGKTIQALLASLNVSSRSLEQNLPGTLRSLHRVTASLARALDRTGGKKTLLHLITSDKKAYHDIMFILHNLKEFTYKLRKDPSIILWRNQK